VHEIQRQALRRLCQHLLALQLKTRRMVGIRCIVPGYSVVTQPDLKQVTQDKNRIGRGVRQIALPGTKGFRLAGLQVQV